MVRLPRKKSKHIDGTLGLKCDHRLWPWPWPWPWIFKVKYGICYISAKNGPIAMERKANISIELQGLKCDHQVWPWPWPWPWIFRVNYGISYISAKSGSIATKRKANLLIELQGLKCDHQVWPWPWPWPWIFKVIYGISYISAKSGSIATKRKANILIEFQASNVTNGFDLDHNLDLWNLKVKRDLWPHTWPWPWIFMVKFWNSCISEWEGRLTLHKGCGSRSFMTMTVTIWWLRSGVWIYQIVTGVTSVVGVPSTHLVLKWCLFLSISCQIIFYISQFPPGRNLYAVGNWVIISLGNMSCDLFGEKQIIWISADLFSHPSILGVTLCFCTSSHAATKSAGDAATTGHRLLFTMTSEKLFRFLSFLAALMALTYRLPH